jgi:hypothetical protein
MGMFPSNHDQLPALVESFFKSRNTAQFAARHQIGEQFEKRKDHKHACDLRSK